MESSIARHRAKLGASFYSFQTDSVERFTEALHNVGSAARFEPLASGSFSGRVCVVRFPRIALIEFDAPRFRIVEESPRDYVGVSVPKRGAFGVRSGGQDWELSARGEAAYVHDPLLPFQLTSGPDLTVRAALFFGSLADEYGAADEDAAHRRGVRGSQVPLRSSWGAAYARQIELLWREIEGDSPVLRSPALVANLEDILGTLLLRTLRPEAPPRLHPIHVRRAQEYIEAYRENPLRLADIAQAAGTSVSTLTRAFRNELGMGPMAYLKQRRLYCARRELLRGDPSRISVTEIAMNCGFAHLSRFAAEYRRHFGELPSETLRR